LRLVLKRQPARAWPAFTHSGEQCQKQGGDWANACLSLLRFMWRGMTEIGQGLPDREEYTIEDLKIPDGHDCLLLAIDDDTKMSSFLSFLNQKNGGGKKKEQGTGTQAAGKQAAGAQAVATWLKKTLDRDNELDEVLKQVAGDEDANIDWVRVRGIVTRQIAVRLLLFLCFSVALIVAVAVAVVVVVRLPRDAVWVWVSIARAGESRLQPPSRL